MTEWVLRTIQEYAMIEQGDSVMVCVSGGADSMALLHFLWSNREQLGIGHLSACHLNHGLRGEESDREEVLVRSYCERLSVPLAVERAHMLELEAEKGESTELRARNLRYAFFERAAGESTRRIAVAHTQNDNAETVVFNLARGTGLRGAGGIPPVRGRYVRPLIGVSRQQVEAYCAENDVPFAVDSSNNCDQFTRNRIRHGVLPAMEGINVAAVRNLAAFSKKAALASRYIEKQANKLLDNAKLSDGYSAQVLLEEDDIVLQTALKLLVAEFCDPSEERVQRCADVLCGRKNGAQLVAGVTLWLKDGVFCIKEETAPKVGREMPLLEGENRFCDGVTVTCTTEEIDVYNSDKETLKNILNNCIDCDKIEGVLFLRPRCAGDKFASHRRGVTKSLKNIFQERGIDIKDRDSFPLVCDEGGIAFIAGEGPSVRHAATTKTVKVKRIQISKEEN